jgi:hypothetical protein
MNYQQLAFIADTYTPILIALTLLQLYKQRQSSNHFKASVIVLLSSTVFIYAMMFIDQWFGIWPAMNMDYSTHTAIALVFVIYLAGVSRFYMVAAVLSLIAYCFLMLYQQYHTIADMVTTALMVSPVVVWLNHRFVSQFKIN